MAYFQTKTAGEPRTVNGTTGAGTDVKMPNSGTSVISNTTTETFVLQAPIQGCKKRIVVVAPSTAVLPVIRATTSNGTAVSFVGATTGINIMTLTTARTATIPLVIDLEGFNSTSWLITGMFPDTTLFTAVALTSGA